MPPVLTPDQQFAAGAHPLDKLKNLNAILTGASHGIGPYIARAMAAEGINLVLAARSTGELEGLAGSLRDHIRVMVATTDVNDPGDRLELVQRTQSELGKIDILINNAGLEEITPFAGQRPEMIENIVATNVIAPILLARAVLPPMLERGSGRIVNVASIAGRAGMPFGAVYSGSKGALAEWSISLHAELAGSGVSVSTVCPGFVSTSGMHARKGKAAPGTLGEVTPEAVAKAVIRALHTGHPEILVSARPMRVLMALRALAPRAALGLARRTGMIDYLKALAGATDSARPT